MEKDGPVNEEYHRHVSVFLDFFFKWERCSWPWWKKNGSPLNLYFHLERSSPLCAVCHLLAKLWIQMLSPCVIFTFHTLDVLCLFAYAHRLVLANFSEECIPEIGKLSATITTFLIVDIFPQCHYWQWVWFWFVFKLVLISALLCCGDCMPIICFVSPNSCKTLSLGFPRVQY